LIFRTQIQSQTKTPEKKRRQTFARQTPNGLR